MFSHLNKTDRYILICSFFIFFVNGLYAMVFGSLLPLLSESYQLSDTVSGALISSHQLGNLIASFIAGVLPVYLGRKNSILFLSSFAVLGFLLIITTGQPWLLLLAFFFTGISRGSISNFNNKTVNDITGSSPSALNLLHSLFAVGALLSPFLVILTSKIFGDKGWKVSGIVIIFLIILSIILFSQMKITDESPKEKHEHDKTAGLAFLKSRVFWNASVILFFYVCAEAAITGWLVKYFVDAGIMGITEAQVLSSVLWIGILIGRIGMALFGMRFPKGNVLTLISASTAFFYIFLLTATSYSIILFLVLGLGFSMGGIYPTAITIAGRDIKDYPMAMGWLLVMAGMGGILMPIITGFLSSMFGILAGMAAIVVAIIIMVLGVVFYARS